MRQIALIASVVLAAAAIAAAISALSKPPLPKPLTFDERWSNAMVDIYGSQENLRRSGHITVKTEIICTKRFCDPHPKGERR